MKLYVSIVSLLIGFGFAQETLISPENVLSVVTADWNSDAAFDRAVLVATEPTFSELFIYLSDTESSTMNLALHMSDAAWRGAMWGTQPTLELNEVGSLQIYSANDVVGRNRWRQTLTVAYREGEFILAGYTYTAYDTLNLDNQLVCDLNLVTGEGTKNEVPITFDMPAPAMTEVTSEFYPEICHDR